MGEGAQSCLKFRYLVCSQHLPGSPGVALIWLEIQRIYPSDQGFTLDLVCEEPHTHTRIVPVGVLSHNYSPFLFWTWRG